MTNRPGRPRKKASDGKRAMFSTRMSLVLRENLDRASAKSGKSLSQEIEDRLRRSFDVEKQITESFEGKEKYGLARLFIEIIEAAEMGTFLGWAEDPYVHQATVRAVAEVFEAFRPDGEIKRPTRLPDFFGDDPATFGQSIARGILQQLLESADEPPMDKGHTRYAKQLKVFPRIRTNLGEDLMGRLK